MLDDCLQALRVGVADGLTGLLQYLWRADGLGRPRVDAGFFDGGGARGSVGRACLCLHPALCATASAVLGTLSSCVDPDRTGHSLVKDTAFMQ